jgi:cysteine-S-conjugate beta-lyase
VACDFDQIIDRCCSDSVKWSSYDADVLPLWVADTDFCAPEVVVRALQERVAHGVFGYCAPSNALREVVQDRLSRLYGWSVQPDEIRFIPGVVSGFNLVCRAVGLDGDEVLVQPPIYPPMLTAPGNAGRVLTSVPLVEANGRFAIDFEAFEAAITPQTSLFLLCSPHNPTGRVFERDELAQLADICLRHDVVICSDEIHCDIVYSGYRHIPIATLDPEVAAHTVTVFAPSKTFNIPGLKCSVAVAQNPELMQALNRAAAGILPGVNVLGYTAALAAYRDGGPWLDELLVYLEQNRDFLLAYLERHMPAIRCFKPEGTFLAWLDCRQAGIPGSPYEFFLERARVALNEGGRFGEGGEGWLRLNFGCPRATLAEALDRMRAALQNV